MARQKRRPEVYHWRVLSLIGAGVLAMVLAPGGGGNPTPTPTATAVAAQAARTPTAVDVTGLIGLRPPKVAAKYEELIRKAREEGELVLVVSRGTARRHRSHMQDFGKTYGINMVISGGRGSRSANKLLAERRAGRYPEDIWMQGPGTSNHRMIPAGALVELPRLLFDPKVTNPKLWRANRTWWGDPERKFVFLFILRASGEFATHKDVIDPANINSYHFFLQDRWKGRMMIQDPRVGGVGASIATYLVNPKLGEPFLRKIYGEMDVIPIADARQLVIKLNAKDPPLAFPLGSWGRDVENAVEDAGLPLAAPRKPLKEGLNFSGGGSNVISVLKNGPNRNAAQLFLNYWLGPESQRRIQLDIGEFSLRTDIGVEGVKPKGIIPESIDVASNPVFEKEEFWRADQRAQEIAAEELAKDGK